MEFSQKSYSLLKTRLKRSYKTRFSRIIKQLKKFPKSQTTQWYLEHQFEFAEFTPYRWYFLEQLETLLFFLSQNHNESRDEEFSEEDDLIFETWNKSEFADIFLKQLNKRKPLREASLHTANIFDQHLFALGNIHLLRTPALTTNYRIQSSLGDVKKRGKISRLLETTLHLNGKELQLMTSTLEEMKVFSTRIEVATRVIKHFSPESWKRFSAFTEVIIPIKQQEFVSYSHQELPGTSMINMYDRDFVDLLDDLTHENGHHHLNYYLNLEDLIQEPIDCIYYSPWRRTLRPLRGIFHAYLTFFWAFNLFSDIAMAKDFDSSWYVFNKDEKEKIIWRAIEEYWMLTYSYHDLKWAHKQGLISAKGWKLIQEQNKTLLSFKSKITKWEPLLKTHKTELNQLKKTLEKSRKKYPLT